MIIGNLQNNSAAEFEFFFNQIIDLKISEKEIVEFLLALNRQDLPSNAFVGAVGALKKRMKIISAPGNTIDVCGTGGDKLNTLNISTAVCFITAAAGVSTAKHGNKAVSSMSGSADIFSELGVKISSDISEIEKNLQEKKLCFLFAPFFHEALKNVAEIRKNLAIPTIFNFLGPLLNPANTNLQLIGTSRKSVMPKIANVISLNEQAAAYIVHGMDGMDEISICSDSYLLRVENGKIFDEEIINPEKFGFKKIAIEDIQGRDPKYNSQKLISLLNGEKSAYRDIVTLNAAFALRLAKKVVKIEDGLELTKSVIDSGKALKILKLMQE